MFCRMLLKPWQHAARIVPRVMGPFIDMTSVILCGVEYDGVPEDEWDLDKLQGM